MVTIDRWSFYASGLEDKFTVILITHAVAGLQVLPVGVVSVWEDLGFGIQSDVTYPHLRYPVPSPSGVVFTGTNLQ